MASAYTVTKELIDSGDEYHRLHACFDPPSREYFDTLGRAHCRLVDATFAFEAYMRELVASRRAAQEGGAE